MRYSPVMEVCKTQSEPEKGEMLEKNHDDDEDDDDEDDDDDDDCENVTKPHEDECVVMNDFDQILE